MLGVRGGSELGGIGGLRKQPRRQREGSDGLQGGGKVSREMWSSEINSGGGGRRRRRRRRQGRRTSRQA